MPALERRSLEVEVRAPAIEEGGLEQDGLPREFWARVCNYDVLDNYGTLFREGCFDESVERRLPRFMYGHGGWENPLALVGKGVEARSVRGKGGGLDVKFQLDDFDYVPVARQIAYQLKEGTLDRFSVGFIRRHDTRAPSKGGTYIDRADLAEVSVLPEGSVPGTKVLAFRSLTDGTEEDGAGPHVIAVDDVARIITRFSLGELSLVQALQAVVDESTASITEEEEAEEDEDTPSDPDPDGGDGDGGDPDQGDTSDPEGSEEVAVVEGTAGEEAPEPFVDEEADALLAEAELLISRAPRPETRKEWTK